MPDTHDLAALAAPLLALFPASTQADARPLIHEFLRLELQGEASHAKPARLRDIVVGDLRDALLGAPESERLQTLRAERDHAQQQHIAREAVAMSVARYLIAHPSADPGGWLSERAQFWQAQGEGAIALEATELLNQLETYAAHLQVLDPERAEGSKGNLHAARMALQSARSGSFQSAWGPLADFLRAVGADFQVLEVRFS
ncbi:MAG: hypothetical protein VX899_25575 [Myxococcota bacterium]|nr:hypothetical protein [Myxococcota bacterium]